MEPSPLKYNGTHDGRAYEALLSVLFRWNVLLQKRFTIDLPKRMGIAPLVILLLQHNETARLKKKDNNCKYYSTFS